MKTARILFASLAAVSPLRFLFLALKPHPKLEVESEVESEEDTMPDTVLEMEPSQA